MHCSGSAPSPLLHPDAEPCATRGLVMNWGWRYDLLVRVADAVMFAGELRTLPLVAADLAELQSGDAVLDVGCGTGAFALHASARVGESGRVTGIDPGRRQIARALAKVSKAGVRAEFRVGAIEALDFPDRSFDVAVSMLMMHHLPDDLKQQGLRELARVLKPCGRLVVIDFRRPESRPGRQRRFGAGTQGIQDLPPLLEAAGFEQLESGAIDRRKKRMPTFIRARRRAE